MAHLVVLQDELAAAHLGQELQKLGILDLWVWVCRQGVGQGLGLRQRRACAVWRRSFPRGCVLQDTNACSISLHTGASQQLQMHGSRTGLNTAMQKMMGQEAWLCLSGNW